MNNFKEKNMYLTDKQYLDLLKRGLKLLNNPRKIIIEDCTILGCKNNTCNVGLCNDNQLCTPKIAMFPEEFPQRKDIKYREIWHKCPLDWRTEDSLDMNGCFWSCRVFQAKKNEGKISNEVIINLYKEQIKYAEKLVNDRAEYAKKHKKINRLEQQCNNCIHWTLDILFENDTNCMRNQNPSESTLCSKFKQKNY